ncbi:MAG TPA: tRNA glutamyl-Q(34) synthetase GluQRS [Gammaproteobacteria bacterium]|nr:tRNA glutamyl-Q(34) synthetase GluQRS [Gammaproteobacteria bacterium]
MTSCYIGRFAPSPSGPLHFGSVIAALGSFLQARSRGGQWLVRMEDIDIPRVQPGAADDILRTLEKLHLFWDGEVFYQSRGNAAYREAEALLESRQLLYPCACTRRDIQGQRYSGHCRNGLPPGKAGRSVRIKTTSEPVSFADRVQGVQWQNLQNETGDFIIRRADNITAYHLAVVVDDAWQGVTEIVRGNDLMDSTPRQIYLQELLGYPTPDYCHLPVAVNPDGRKISKQNHAPGVRTHSPSRVLHNALQFLGQGPDPALRDASIETVIDWGIKNWDLEKVPRLETIMFADDHRATATQV